jgi:hypothetical protein
MASKGVSAKLVPGAEGTVRFRCRLLIRFDALSVVHLRSFLYSSHDVISSRFLTMTFTTPAFGRSSSWLFEACSYKTGFEGPTFISSTASRAHERVLDTTPPQIRTSGVWKRKHGSAIEAPTDERVGNG